MGEKRYSVQSGYVVDLVTGNLLNCHDTRNLLNTQSAEIEELKEIVKKFAPIYSFKDMVSRRNCYDPDSIKKAQRILELLGVETLNPSEIPNSSEFLVTEADQREADRAIADGSAKLKLPETGHGITEVQDAEKS